MQTLIDQSTNRDNADTLISPPDLSWLPGFADVDIDHNEAGYLSPDQRLELQEDMALATILSAIGAALFLVPTLISGNVVMAVIFGGVFAVIGTVALGSGLGDLRDGRVAAAEGDLRAEFIRGGEDPDEYWLYVDGLKLATNNQLYEAIQPGGPYRVFYMPGSKRVVAARALPGWKTVCLPSSSRSGR